MITKIWNSERIYPFEVSGSRRTDKNFKLLLNLKDEIEKGNFPILWVGKKQNATIISYEEYLRLKRIEEDFKKK
jgi:hypothetical protein